MINQNPPRFETLSDAQTYYINSGVFEWEWFEGFHAQAFVDYLYWRSTGELTFDDLVRDFLIEHGENPADYSL